MALDCTRGQREKQNAIDAERRANQAVQSAAIIEAIKNKTIVGELKEKIEALEAEVANLKKQLFVQNIERDIKKTYGVFKLKASK